MGPEGRGSGLFPVHLTPRHLDMDRMGNVTSHQTRGSPSVGEENQGVTGGQSGTLGPCIWGGGLLKLGGNTHNFSHPSTTWRIESL